MRRDNGTGQSEIIMSSAASYPADITSSSAVAGRPRDALCRSVVSINRIITHAESFIKPPLATAKSA